MNVFSSKFVPRIYEVRGRFVYYKEKFILRILPRDLESKHSKTNYWQKLMYTALIACTLRSSILHNIYTTGNEGHIILQRIEGDVKNDRQTCLGCANFLHV